MDERLKLSFEHARDSSKQLLTLSTAILTVTVTLATAQGDDIPADARGWLVAAWIAFVVSMLAGAWALLALTGTIDPSRGGNSPSIYGKNIVIPAGAQVLTFLGASALAAYAGYVAMNA